MKPFLCNEAHASPSLSETHLRRPYSSDVFLSKMQPFGVHEDIQYRKYSNGLMTTSPSKCGTRIPNRVFVGGIPPSTTEADVLACFSKYGNVRAVKLIIDKAGVPKGYGFVTFETEDEANAVLKAVELEGGSLPFKDRKLNIGEAVRKIPAFFGEDASRSVTHHCGGPVMPELMPTLPPNVSEMMFNYYLPPFSIDSAGYSGGSRHGVGGPGGSMGWPHQPDHHHQWNYQQPLPHFPTYAQMMYQQQQALLADTPPPSDLSSWSSAGSCASSTCSTASFGNTGEISEGAAGVAANFFPPSDQSMYFYYQGAPGPVADTGGGFVGDEDVKSDVPGEPASGSMSLTAKIRDRRRAQQKSLDTNNNCPKEGEEKRKEIPVISVSKILEDSTDCPRSVSSSPGVSSFVPPAMYHQYCPPSYQCPPMLYTPQPSHQHPMLYPRPKRNFEPNRYRQCVKTETRLDNVTEACESHDVTTLSLDKLSMS